MRAPSISVIIPAFNRAATLLASMRSVLSQSYEDFELLVVDDCSSDDTVSVARSLSDPRIRIIQNAVNLGAGGARNAGVANSRGKWVAFQDSDDEWLPTKLEKQMSRLDAQGADHVAAYCGLLRLGGLDNDARARMTVGYVPDPRYTIVDGQLLEGLLRTSLISTQTLIVRRDVFDRIGGFDERTTPIEDWDFALSLCQEGRIALVDEPLVLQRFSPNSITRQHSKRLASQVLVLEKHQALFAGHPGLLAFHYCIIAGGFRRQGNLAAARSNLARAIRLDPTNLSLWARAILVSGHSLLPGSRRLIG